VNLGTLQIGRGLLRQGFRNVRAAGPRRLAMTAILLAAALLLARFSWQVWVVQDAERALYDLRVYTGAAQTDQDPRIQLVVYDDQTLLAVRKRSPLDRGLLAKALVNLDRMGARSIGIDILFDQPQDEDDALVATLRAMQTPVFVGYARTDSNRESIQYEQQQYLESFLGRLRGSRAQPASVRLGDDDGVMRRWPAIIAGEPPSLTRAMLAGAGAREVAAFEGYTGAIRFRRQAESDRPQFAQLRIDLFADPSIAEALADQVRGRFVLIGGDIVDLDRFKIPFSAWAPSSGKDDEFAGAGASPPGIQIHATMIAQMLDGARLPALAQWQLWLIAGFVILIAALTALVEASPWKALPLLAGQLLVIAGIPFVAQQQGYDTLDMPAAGLILGWMLAFAAVASAARASGAVERRFAQSALGRYLPQDVAQEIIDHPERLTLTGAKAELFILFSDLEGFTQLSHELDPEVVARLLNDYLDRLSQVVLDHGGLVDKYVGDAVVAFWGAPIARPDDGRCAAEAAYAMWQEGEAFRRSIDVGAPIGRTRIGLHHGEAIVGNFGGERRIQYTALGAAMNTAARLEAANKSLKTSVIASRDFAERSGLDWWRPMGTVIVRGRSQPIDLFEAAPDFPAKDREDLAKAVALIEKDRASAIALIAGIAARHGSDKALDNLLARTRNLGEGNAYVLA